MVNIPKHVQEFLPGKMGWVATASKAGEPNVTPKGSLTLLDDQHIIFADLFSLKTRRNLQENPQVAVTVIDGGTAKGYQIKGQAEMLTAGSLFEEMPASPAVSGQNHGAGCVRSIRWPGRGKANRLTRVGTDAATGFSTRPSLRS